MIGFRIGLRIVGLFVVALAATRCGDGGGGDNASDVGSPPPGTFAGALADGGTIELEVGSIDAIAFTCDGQSIRETFSPPRPVDADGRFAVQFTDAGRTFQVRGQFENDDRAHGTVDDAANACDTTFTASRGDPVTPTRTRTPTDGVTPPTPTATPTVAATDTAPGPTGQTPTKTPTPTPTCTSSCEPICPVAVEVVGNAGNKAVLDSGWTGLAHNSQVISDGKLTFNVACNGTTRPCGVCNVSGPIQNLKADQGDINAHRCSNDTSIKCTDNTVCGAGTCVFFFGAPLPLSAGQISTCVVNQINGAVTGTANVESGAFASSITLRSSVFTGALDKPCPRCVGDGASNDGTRGGTCEDGPRAGQACDVNGASPVTAFGSTSLDCPPVAGAKVAALTIALIGSSGTEKTTLSASSPACGASDVNTKKCFCPQAGTESTKPSACIDDSLTLDKVEGCVPVSAGSNRGQCELAAITKVCTPTETFRGCDKNSDCPASGDTCVAIRRPCYLDNGEIGGSVTALGKADPPDSNGVSNPTFASLFCIPPTTAAAVNGAGGLPGLGRIELPLISKQIFTLP